MTELNFFIKVKKRNLIIQEHYHLKLIIEPYMQEIGKGFTGLSNFCGFINLPPDPVLKPISIFWKK